MSKSAYQFWLMYFSNCLLNDNLITEEEYSEIISRPAPSICDAESFSYLQRVNSRI